MISKKFGFVIVFCLFSLSDCTPSIKVKVLKPPLLDIGSIKRIEVIFTEFRGHWDLADHTKWPRNLEELGVEVLSTLAGLRSDTGPPDPLETYPGKTLSAGLIARLVDNGYYTIVENEDSADMGKAGDLAYAAVPEDKKAEGWRPRSDVDAVLIGAGTYCVTDEGEWEEYTGYTQDKEGKNQTQESRRYRISRKIEARITYRIVKGSDGQVITGSTISASNSPQDDSATGEDEVAAQRELPDWYPILVKLVDKLLDRMVRQIAPYYIEEWRRIERGKGAEMKKALKYAEQGMWEEAKRLWEGVIQDSSSKSKNNISATHNLGLYHELQGRLTQAESLYNECYRASEKSRCQKAVERIQKRKKELQKLIREIGLSGA